MLDGRHYAELAGVSWVGTSEWKSEREKLVGGNTLVYFRAVVEAAPASECRLLISANSRYKLWVNGKRVGEGPCRGDRYRQYFDSVDIGEHLVSGTNAIAVEVLYFSPAPNQQGRKTGPMCVVTNTFGPLLAVSGKLQLPDGTSTDLCTGKFNWQYQIDRAVAWEMRDVHAFMVVGAFEHVEAAKLPGAWKSAGASEEAWQPAVQYFGATGSGWGHPPALPPAMRPIPMMFHRERGFGRLMRSSSAGLANDFRSIEVPPNSSAFFEVDAEELVTGYPRLQCEGGLGASVKMTYAESYSNPPLVQYRVKGRRDDCDNFEFFGSYDVLRASGGGDSYEPYWWRTFRFVRVEVTTGRQAIKIHRPDFVDVGYPLKELSRVKSGACDWLEPLWRISVRTLQRCTHETHEDCPYYEQLQYALDTRLQILFAYALGNDARMAKKTIEDFHSTLMPEGLLFCRAPSDEPSVIPVFSLYWIMMLEDYYLETGDSDFVARLRPTIDAVLSWFDRHIGREGLVESIFYWEFIDWVEEWQDSNRTITAVPNSARDTGRCTTTSLIYATALQSASRLLSLSRPETAAEYAARAEKVKQCVEVQCWDSSRGMYQEGIGTGEYTQHAQAFAVLCGLASGQRAGQVLTNAMKPGGALECTYVMAFFLFRALEQAGEYEQTRWLWNKWTDALPSGVTTWPEDLTRQRSDCHAWGSLPLYEFVRCFLGVRALEPGYRRILIQPLCTYIPELEGEAMTPHGPVRVKWRIAGGKMQVAGSSPAGVPATLRGPRGGEVQLEQGGSFEAEFPL